VGLVIAAGTLGLCRHVLRRKQGPRARENGVPVPGPGRGSAAAERQTREPSSRSRPRQTFLRGREAGTSLTREPCSPSRRRAQRATRITSADMPMPELLATCFFGRSRRRDSERDPCVPPRSRAPTHSMLLRPVDVQVVHDETDHLDVGVDLVEDDLHDFAQPVRVRARVSTPGRRREAQSRARKITSSISWPSLISSLIQLTRSR
jgi:hypothetical protein